MRIHRLGESQIMLQYLFLVVVVADSNCGCVHVGKMRGVLQHFLRLLGLDLL